MLFVAIALASLAVPFALVVGVWAGILRLRRRNPRRFLRRAAVLLALLAPIHVLGVVPLALGWVGSRVIGTRWFERGYAGPTFAEFATVHLASDDGLRLRAFHVPARAEPARGSWVLAHGLFRSALEVEPVAAMLHELGAEVLMLDLRNHGGSGRAPATFGVREAEDVRAAARWLRARSGGDTRIGLFGVSLGAVATACAAPRVDGLAALVLDAPIEDLRGTAERMLARGPRRSGAIPWPIGTLALECLELWSGVELVAIRPYAALRALPPDVAVLLIGAGTDFRAPPERIRALARTLPAESTRVWIREGSSHGKVWLDDPEGYRTQLAWIVGRVPH